MTKNKDTIQYTSKDTVSCNGGSSSVGHPQVFLPITTSQTTLCPYCGQLFQKQDSQN